MFLESSTHFPSSTSADPSHSGTPRTTTAIGSADFFPLIFHILDTLSTRFRWSVRQRVVNCCYEEANPPLWLVSRQPHQLGHQNMTECTSNNRPSRAADRSVWNKWFYQHRADCRGLRSISAPTCMHARLTDTVLEAVHFCVKPPPPWKDSPSSV